MYCCCGGLKIRPGFDAEVVEERVEPMLWRAAVVS